MTSDPPAPESGLPQQPGSEAPLEQAARSEAESEASLKYQDAGVDISAGNLLVERIKPAVRSTARPGVLGALGGFGGLFELPWQKYKAPVLVSGTDGVGTKLLLAIETGRHCTIGIDLVAMCVNDIIVTGAEPLFFLDYFATGKLDVDQGTDIISGIAAGCEQAGAALLGGETAEMPGMYSENDYDLAGFAVGLVEKADIIDGSSVSAGDAIIGLASSGPHSNGYSLIHSVLRHCEADLSAEFDSSSADGSTLLDALLTPTRIYVKSVRQAIDAGIELKALAHITGGGLLENIPRVLPDGVDAEIFEQRWHTPAIFSWLQRNGNIASDEMHRVFNCGIGMIVIVEQQQLDSALQAFSSAGETPWHIGDIIPSGMPPGRQAARTLIR